MIYREEDWLALSGIQHASFCLRQWALIHLEGVWQENLLTAEGRVQHDKAHDDHADEKRGEIVTVRALRVSSATLGVSGECDVVELRACDEGVPLYGRPGRWTVRPVEYKHGAPKPVDADRLQVCVQAMCLEEMLGCDIPQGDLFYQMTRRREVVELDDGLRQQAKKLLEQMHDLARRGYTPRGRREAKCRSCSLMELCLPGLPGTGSVDAYLNNAVEEASECDT